MRDLNDNVMIVCSIENVDPMGVHTGMCREGYDRKDASGKTKGGREKACWRLERKLTRFMVPLMAS